MNKMALASRRQVRLREGRSFVFSTCMIIAVLFWVPVTAVAEEGQTIPRILDLHNVARETARFCGSDQFEPAGPLLWDEDLAAAALVHARDIAEHQIRGHVGSDGSAPFDRTVRFTDRFSGVGENVAYFQADEEQAMHSWIASPGHCANIMRGNYTHLGAAMVMGPRFSNPERSAPYWVVKFGVSPTSPPLVAGSPGQADPFYVSEADIQYLRSQDIVVYGRTTCGRTAATMRLFDEKGIRYRFADIDSDPENNRELWARVRASGQAESVTENGVTRLRGVTLPVVDVGGRVSIDAVRTASILAAIRQQPVPRDPSVDQRVTRSSELRNPQYRNPGLGLGLGGGIFMQEDGSEFYSKHRLHMMGQVGWRMGDIYRRRSLVEAVVQAKIGAETDLDQDNSSYAPFTQATAGLVFQDSFRISAGVDIATSSDGTGSMSQDTEGWKALRIIGLALTSRAGARVSEVFLSYHHALDAKLDDFEGGTWQLGMTLGLLGR